MIPSMTPTLQIENTTQPSADINIDNSQFHNFLIVVMSLSFFCAVISIFYTARSQQNRESRILRRVQTFVSSVEEEEEEEKDDEKKKTIL
jgi:hypothetical protein